MNTASVVLPDTTQKKRFGLIPARIGADVPHKIGVELSIDEPLYSTATQSLGSKTRTRLAPANPKILFAPNARGELIATKALPGATVYLTVQDLSRLEPELADSVKWVCRHPDCAGKKHDSKAALIQSHPKNRDLIDDAEKDPRGGHAHVYYGVLEIAAADAKKDGKTGAVQAAQASTVMLLSDEE